MPVEALDHVQLAMPPGGEDAAHRFYAGLLGIPKSQAAHLAGRGGCCFVLTLSLPAQTDR